MDRYFCLDLEYMYVYIQTRIKVSLHDNSVKDQTAYYWPSDWDENIVSIFSSL